MTCPCCKKNGSIVTKTLTTEGCATIRFRKCFLCNGRFITEGFSYERLRLVMIKTENHYTNRNLFLSDGIFIGSKPLRLVTGKSGKYIGKKKILNFFLNEPF